jgi:hypothetical protein
MLLKLFSVIEKSGARLSATEPVVASA